MAFWTDAQLQALVERATAGAKLQTIADELGRSLNSVSLKWRRLKHENRPPQPEVSAALPEFARAAGAVPLPSKPQVISKWVDELTITEKWQRAEDENARHVAKAGERDKFSVDFPEDRPIGISFVSDQHIAVGIPVDLARMRADAEYIRDTPGMYALMLGDFVDNHIKHLAAIISGRSTPDDQWQLAEYYLGIIAEKILVACSGNHCAFTVQRAGVDMLGWLMEKQKLCYSPSAFNIEVTVCGQPYTIVGRHQSRFNSSFNKTHAVQQMWRMGEHDFDIGAVGHHHEHAMECDFKRGLLRWYVRPGSYQILSAYSRQYGFNSSVPTCPTMILYPRRREIVGFADLRVAGQFLRSLR